MSKKSADSTEGLAGEDASAERADLLSSYRAFHPDLIRNEVERLREVQEEMAMAWKLEVEKYEQEMTLNSGDGFPKVPRRNYFNIDGVVQDPDLFPYHDACYLLIDAYDCLYSTREEQPFQKGTVRPFYVPPNSRISLGPNESYLDGHLPNSLVAIHESLQYGFLQNPATDQGNSQSQIKNDKKDEEQWKNLLSFNKDPGYWFQKALKSLQEPLFDRKYGPRNFPTNRVERSSLLLKLLKHSLSELQMDYRLAKAVIYQLMTSHDLDDPQTFRRLLVILDDEYKDCDGRCHDRYNMDRTAPIPDHSCTDWLDFTQRYLPDLFTRGISSSLPTMRQ